MHTFIYLFALFGLTVLKVDEPANAPLEPELHEAVLRVERVDGQVVLAEKLGIIRPCHRDGVVTTLKDVRVVHKVVPALGILALPLYL